MTPHHKFKTVVTDYASNQIMVTKIDHIPDSVLVEDAYLQVYKYWLYRGYTIHNKPIYCGLAQLSIYNQSITFKGKQ